MSNMNDKYKERAYETMLSLAYFILNDLKVPEGLQFNLESTIHDKKIHVMLEVLENDD